ncbi:mansc domain containing protein [Anaeramoeba flamelloides]|uniref:Mansc domain containing protein n=1 Tax=Anaeramoeba flamelloides TaxID=1746091 RepID=A0ABQ8ZEA6_9EUKA|nr:mansc domain containing protein [Anaeramoeba flamelloides]
MLISKGFLDESFLYPLISKKKEEEEEEMEEGAYEKEEEEEEEENPILQYFENINKLLIHFNNNKPILENFFVSTKLYHRIPNWVTTSDPKEFTKEKQEILNKANNLPNFNHKKFWLALIDMVKELHSMNYFHRDFRIANIMVEKKKIQIHKKNINITSTATTNTKNITPTTTTTNKNTNKNNTNTNTTTTTTNNNNNNTTTTNNTFVYIPRIIDFDSAYLKSNKQNIFHGGTCCLGPRCMIEKQNRFQYRFSISDDLEILLNSFLNFYTNEKIFYIPNDQRYKYSNFQIYVSDVIERYDKYFNTTTDHKKKKQKKKNKKKIFEINDLLPKRYKKDWLDYQKIKNFIRKFF